MRAKNPQIKYRVFLLCMCWSLTLLWKYHGAFRVLLQVWELVHARTHLLNTNRFSSTKYYVFKMERSQNRNHDYISINYPALPSHRQQNLLLCQVDERVTRSDHGHAWPLAPPLSVRGIVFTVDTQTKNY